MMDYDIEESNLDRRDRLAPGREGPTISPLGKRGLGRGARHGAPRRAPSG